jgi:hypothetical protein
MRRSDPEMAQATVEFVGTLPLLGLGLAVCVQALLVAVGAFVAQPAADRAARGGGRAEVLAAVPTAYRRGARIATRGDRAEVVIRVPAVLPGVGRWLEVHGSSEVPAS